MASFKTFQFQFLQIPISSNSNSFNRFKFLQKHSANQRANQLSFQSEIMNPSPLPPPPTAVVDDNRSSNYSSPPIPLDSLPIASSPAKIPPGPVTLTARSCLYEICAKSRWQRPVFTCCNETGPSNHRSFTYKATIEMKEGLKLMTVVECIGKPQLNKKTAADSAAEGLLWYLVQSGYPKKPERGNKLR